LALLVSIIIAFSLFPNLFIPINQKYLFLYANSSNNVCKIFNEMEWKDKEKKGIKDQKFFISIFTTFIITLYEEDSPLRKHMATFPKSGLGEKWTTKHG
jgi:hypothetical protein